MSWPDPPSGKSRAFPERRPGHVARPPRHRGTPNLRGSDGRRSASLAASLGAQERFERGAALHANVPRVSERDWPPLEEQVHSKRRWWPFLVPLAALVIGVSLLIPGGRHQWALSLFRQPTAYTSLSFNNAASLPTTATNSEPMAVSFTIGNQEGHAIKYRYLLSDSAAGVSESLGGSSKIVPAGKTWTVSTVIRPSCLASPCKIKVSLPGHPETIDFIVTLKAGN